MCVIAKSLKCKKIKTGFGNEKTYFNFLGKSNCDIGYSVNLTDLLIFQAMKTAKLFVHI